MQSNIYNICKEKSGIYQSASLYVVDDQLHIIIVSQVCALAKSDLHFGRCIAMGIQKVSKFMIKTSQNSIAIKFQIATQLYDQLLIKALHKTIAVYIYIYIYIYIHSSQLCSYVLFIITQCCTLSIVGNAVVFNLAGWQLNHIHILCNLRCMVEACILLYE